jgi:hypothetical protein
MLPQFEGKGYKVLLRNPDPTLIKQGVEKISPIESISKEHIR